MVEFADAGGIGPQAGFVASMVGYKMTGQAPSLHRGVPSPYLTFIVNLDAPVVVGTHSRAETDGSARAYDNILGGLHTHAAYLFQPEHQVGIQLAIHPLAARRVFGLPAAELTEIANDAAEVLGGGIGRMQQRVGECETWPQRFGLVNRYLVDRASAAPSFMTPRPEVAAGWRWMVAHRGLGRMDDLALHVAMSARQLTKLFRAEVGVPPKAVNRLIRFDLARQQIQQRAMAGDDLGLTDVATAAGYYDHAHLTRDFGDFLGCSPTAWIVEEFGNIQAGVPVDREQSVA